MAENKKSKIVKRGVVAKVYKYTVTDDNVTTLKGTGYLGNYGSPLKLSAEHLVISDGITSIGDLAFWHNSLRTVYLPNSVTTIGDCAFAHSFLQSVTLPDSITEIGNCAFDECRGLRSIIIPRNLKTIPLGLFRSCYNLQEVDLSNVERIDEDAFYGCESLKQVVIPASVKYIAEGAFKDCVSLETVIFQGRACKIEEPIFEGCHALKKVVLPASYAYRNLGVLWGRDYTSLVNDVVEFLPSETEFPLSAIKDFCEKVEGNSLGLSKQLSVAEKSLRLSESTTIWGFATLTKVFVYGNNVNARYSIAFEEFHEKFEDDWFNLSLMNGFLKKHFLTKPVDKFDGLSNDYFRYLYRWNLRNPYLPGMILDPEFVRASKLMGEEIMSSPWYTLNSKRKIVRLEEPVPVVDYTDAIEGLKKLIGDTQGRIYTPVFDKMIDEYGPVKSCRALGYMIAAGNVLYHENEKYQDGNWSVYKEPIQGI